MRKAVLSALSLAILTAAPSVIPAAPVYAVEETKIVITAKPLTENVQKAVRYLISAQHPSGGWTEGEESKYMASSGHKNSEEPNVADTCVAVMALLRAGNYPNSGEYAKNVERAIGFICGSIEKSDNESLYVTDVRNTRVQQKLGPFVDTFLASSTLSEVVNRMPTAEGNKQVGAALDKVIGKMERNQTKEGTWGGGGWAPIHSQALATRGLNRAKQAGISVKAEVLARAQNYARGNFDADKGSFSSSGSANVPLYAAGSTLGSMQESINTNKFEQSRLEKIAANAQSSMSDRREANDRLAQLKDGEVAQKAALKSVQGRLNDEGFTSGFGCNGGEEFLSYLQISETLIANKSPEWPDWDKKITANLNRVQSNEGSWMGQHCITSRTFCTAAALLVLTADRATANLAMK